MNHGKISIMSNTFTITSNSFKDGAVIKNIYACPENRQPHFAWKGYPETTQCFVIIMDDADAIPVVGHVFVQAFMPLTEVWKILTLKCLGLE